VNKIKSKVSLEWLVVFSCLLIFTGLVSSRALISIGMIALTAVVLFYNGFKNTFREYLRPGAQSLLLVLFLIVFASGLWSDDKIEWLNWVRIKLPYLFIPLAFAGIKKTYSKTICPCALRVCIHYHIKHNNCAGKLRAALSGNQPILFERWWHSCSL
jgi:hypothetical protein